MESQPPAELNKTPESSTQGSEHMDLDFDLMTELNKTSESSTQGSEPMDIEHELMTKINKNPADSTLGYFNLKPNASGLVMVPLEISRNIKREYVVDMNEASSSGLNPKIPEPTSPIHLDVVDMNKASTTELNPKTPEPTSPINPSTADDVYEPITVSPANNHFLFSDVVGRNQASTSGLNPKTPERTSPINPSTADDVYEPVAVSPANHSENNKHYNTPTSSKSSFVSRIPVSIRTTRKAEEIVQALNSNILKIKPRVLDMVQEELDAIKEDPEPVFSSDEDNCEIDAPKNIDVSLFYCQFQKYYEAMKKLNPYKYEMFGMATEYERLLKQLEGFLGELCYYREKRE